MIWFKKMSLPEVNAFNSKCMLKYLDIVFTEITDHSITATMPVCEKTHQPYGYLHGGASVVLAESIGSVAANLTVDMDKYAAFGIEVNANHIKAVRSGSVRGVGRPIHRGVTTQVWGMEIFDDSDNLICVSRLTVAIRKK
ncbi:MAG: hotdog fold thioesterase [Bdellovibrionaceae bacterium]|jgi:1,4-dihydroxy-2-naphthoyl-CoA hydrolase|nr:hotdog fold thioesterase [Pseudobdellovibrionaceae bacterium]